MAERRPKDSNKRSTFRVGVAGAGVRAEINDVRRCTLVDVTSEGFAAMLSQTPFRIDEVVCVKLRYEGQGFSGRACVRDLRETPSGLHRYGFQTLADQEQLRAGLRLVARSEQRKRLRRLANRR